jgi:hypothetical protein
MVNPKNTAKNPQKPAINGGNPQNPQKTNLLQGNSFLKKKI